MDLLKNLRGQSIYEAQQFNRELMEELFDEAEIIRSVIHKEYHSKLTSEEYVYLERIRSHMKSKRMVTLFFQPSTRTQGSFEIAMWLLGGKVVYSSANAKEFSAFAKGESMRDTVRTFCQYYPHIIVIRSHYTGGIKDALEGAAGMVPIISGGDGKGPGQHPTQGLLDCFTIHQKFGKIDGLRIAFVGDLKDSRVINTNCYLLAKFNEVKAYFVSDPCLAMKQEIKDYLSKHNVIYEEHDDLRSVAGKVDAIYMTRDQLEYKDEDEKQRILANRNHDDHANKRCINREVISLMQDHSIIMHPFPRDQKQQEIPEWVDDTKFAYYFPEMNNGLALRMALLKAILV